MNSPLTLFYGSLVTPRSLTAYAALPEALVAVGHDGNIAWLEEDVPVHELQNVLIKHGIALEEGRTLLVELKQDEFLLPGFIDTHTHAPQVPNIGSGQQYELLDWLKYVTFPMEARFANTDFARNTYTHVVRRIIDAGTTTCCYYGTLHLEATQILAKIVHAHGQRAFVGKCNMNRESEDYVEPSTAASLDATNALIKHIRSISGETYSPSHTLVHPILTPRFAISCTSDLLDGLGSIAASDKDLRIQTHVSENAGEVNRTRELFPNSTSYTSVYDDHGLLRDNTILAHAIHLTPDEMALVAKRKAGVSHCPTSNFNLRSGLARVGEMLDAGIKVGLGTDVSGGFSPSILTAIQHASMCSKAVALSAPAKPDNNDKSTSSATFAGSQLPVPTLLYLATQGGANVCALGDRVGSFAPGKAFDALVVSTREDAGNPGLWPSDLDTTLGINKERTPTQKLDTLLERFLFCGDDRNIRRVYVQGRWIGGAEKKD